MPLRLAERLVAAGLACLVAALAVVTVIAMRTSGDDPAVSARAGEQAWGMIEHLFHVGFPAPGLPGHGGVDVIPPAPAAPSSPQSGSAVAQVPAPAPAAPSRAVPIERHASPRPAAPAAPAPAPVAVVPPVVSAPAPTPAPAPAPAPGLLQEIGALLSGLLGLLTGG